LINNRQNGRRRGRGGGPRTPNNAPSPGNRQDNRQRGNAAQLLEKYKAMARDAQLQGDRVQTEFYLQFADHYFRVLGESRARFDEQRRQRGDYSNDDDEDQDEGGSYEAEDRDDREERDERPERQPRFERPSGSDRQGSERQGSERQNSDRQNSERQNSERQGADRQGGFERPERSERQERDYRNGNGNGDSRPRRGRNQPQQQSEEPQGEDHEERISLEVLPPAISADSDDVARTPRRRTRRPRPEGKEDIAPAA
jgi:hypothetical protein